MTPRPSPSDAPYSVVVQVERACDLCHVPRIGTDPTDNFCIQLRVRVLLTPRDTVRIERPDGQGVRSFAITGTLRAAGAAEVASLLISLGVAYIETASPWVFKKPHRN
jgi:hypothetical protein